MGRVFGGYTDISWETVPWFSTTYVEGYGNSFIFSLRDDHTFDCLKCINSQREVRHSQGWFCCFGQSEILLYDGCNADSNRASSDLDLLGQSSYKGS